MRIVIRADAYRLSGAGHVMRSSVIAEQLIDRGYDVIFVGNISEIPWVKDFVFNLGFSEILFSEDEFDSNPSQDILILDSYNILVEEPFIQPNNWKKVVVLVDDATPAYVADIYVHPGAETNWNMPDSASSSLFVSGLEYLLIRNSLRELKREDRQRSSPGVQFLISSGGSDPFGFAENLARTISKFDLKFHAFVVAPDFDLPVRDSRFEMIKLGSKYEELLNSVDFVFTTAGSSSWEYLYLGLPIVLAKAVHNQEKNYRFQIDNNLSLDLGQRNLDSVWQFNEPLIESLLMDTWLNQFEKCKDFELPHGDGAKNIIEILFPEN